MISSCAPIILFVYNRPSHTEQTISALQKNKLADQSDLFIFSDAPKTDDDIKLVQDVRNYIYKIDGFKSVKIVERQKNWGLANSIISGVTDILNQHNKVIVLEDDLLTSPYFLKFMNDSLTFYENERLVGMIHGHIYNISGLPDLFFMYKAGCLGWGTWKRAWNEVSFDGKKLLQEIKENKLEYKFDINKSYPYVKMLSDQVQGKNNSWAIRLYASFILKDMLTFYPGNSLVSHIGFDIGTHCSGAQSASDMDGVIYQFEITSKHIEVINNNHVLLKLEKFYKSQRRPSLARYMRKYSTKFFSLSKKLRYF